MGLVINGKTMTEAFINGKTVIAININGKNAFQVNKTFLEQEIAISNTYTSNMRWTTTSWNAFVAQRTTSTNMYNNPSATQTQVNDAKDALYNARVYGLAYQPITVAFTGSWSGQYVNSARDGYAVIYGTGTINFNTNVNNFGIWLVGGGGGGGGSCGKGNGGAGAGGGGRNSVYNNLTMSAGNYAIYIGGGGTGILGADTVTFGVGGTGGRTWLSQYGNGGVEWVGAAGGDGGGGAYVYNHGNGGNGGSGGGGGAGNDGNAYGGIGGANGGNGYAGGGVNPGLGGYGDGINQTPFRANGWMNTENYGRGGIGGAYASANAIACANTGHIWSGAALVRHGAANSGAGGGGAVRGESADTAGTHGGSGIVMIRWFD